MALRESAVKRGLHVSEYGILDDATGETTALRDRGGASTSGSGCRGSRPSCARAAASSRRPPRARSPSSSTLGDLRGDLHSHTVLSDGRQDVEAMVEGARARGYEYLAITDHSATPRLRQRRAARRAARPDRADPRAQRRARRTSTLLIGTETNILTDGSLDYDDELLAELDWVVASVHTSFAMSEADMTARMIAAIEHPYVDQIGHPTGRKIETRAALPDRHGAGDRGGGAHAHDARDQRRARPPRPERDPRARGGARRAC